MEGISVTEVCRLCPSSENLICVFDRCQSTAYNLKEVILVTTGIEILETDMISKKLCQKCCNITFKMFQFRQDANKQNRHLIENCRKLLLKGIKLPNTCITIRKESADEVPAKRPKFENETSSDNNSKPKKQLHPSIADIYKTYPQYKLPKKCFESHLAPVVSLCMGEVESYFKSSNLDMKQYIYRPQLKSKLPNQIAKKKTTTVQKVSPIKISKTLQGSHHISTPEIAPAKVLVQNDVNASSPPRVSSPTASSSSRTNTPKSSTNAPKSSANSLKAYKRPKTPSVLDRSDVQTAAVASINESVNKPDFIESLGLTPTVTTTKSQPLHVCPVCGSNHTTAFDLRRHLNKHMVCQFCKARFKSVDAKQNHIDHDCHVKKIMNCRCLVKLQKIEQDRMVRKQYESAFTGYPALPSAPKSNDDDGGILPELARHVTAEVDNIDDDPPTEIIVLSDDDDEPSETTNPSQETVAATSEKSQEIPVPPLVFNSAIVRPDVRIQNNTFLKSIGWGVTETALLIELLNVTAPPNQGPPVAVDKGVQTELPSNDHIKMAEVEGTCEFKYLKEQLKSYKVPIFIKQGPFSVKFDFTQAVKPNRPKATFDNLSLVDITNVSAIQNGKPPARTVTRIQTLGASPLIALRPNAPIQVPPSSVPQVAIIQNISLSVAYPKSSTTTTFASLKPVPIEALSRAAVSSASPTPSTSNAPLASTSAPLTTSPLLTQALATNKPTLRNYSPNVLRPRTPNKQAQHGGTINSITGRRFRVKSIWELQ